jgi:hypothetical protein
LYVLKRLVLQLACAGCLALLALADARAQSGWWGQPQQQEQAPPPSRGENFSAGKSPAQLFASDCTGSGCHKGPQGLGKDRNRIGLAGFLREHYTNSRESAAALAAYLVSVPGETRAAKPERQPRAAARSDDAAKPADEAARTRKPAEETKPAESKPAESKPASAKPPRGRQATAAPAPAAAPPAPEPPAPPPEPPKPAKPQWDIFD